MLLALFAARAHCSVSHNLQGLFSRAPRYQPVLLPRVLLTQEQGFTFALVEFHKIPAGPFLQLDYVPMDGKPVLDYIDC